MSIPDYPRWRDWIAQEREKHSSLGNMDWDGVPSDIESESAPAESAPVPETDQREES